MTPFASSTGDMRSGQVRISALLIAFTLVAGACSGSGGDPESQSGSIVDIPSQSVSTGSAALDGGVGQAAFPTVDALPVALQSAPLEVWSNAGATVVEPSLVIRAIDHGVVPDDGESDSAAVNAAITEARKAGGGVVVLPEGRILLTETIHLYSDIFLRGQGPSTRLEIDFGGSSGNGISASGSTDDLGWKALEADAPMGSHEIEVFLADAVAGDLLEIEQDNDKDRMVTQPAWDVDWGIGSEGEMVLVNAGQSPNLTLENPLISSYTADRSAKVRLVRAVSNISVEDLTITRLDEGYGHSIRFRYAVDVRVLNVTSTNTSRAHIALEQVANCEVNSSVLHGATDFGDGGRAYGISLSRHTTSCLVENNTLYDLRHALIIQLGASGNVLAFNHARGSAGYEDKRPRADISLHGHWPQQNLFEGNIVDRVEIADWWGPAGPGNTFHRNCILDHVIILDASEDQFFTANYFSGKGVSIDPSIQTIGMAANVGPVEGPASVTPLDSAAQFSSLWSDTAPAEIGAWPPIDPSQGPSTCDLPASRRSPLGNR